MTLPGEPVSQRGFPDQWNAVLPSSATGSGGTASNPATYNYAPTVGVRDQIGSTRVKDPNSDNVGFGSRPYFDDGAFEFIIQNPPVVGAVVTVSGATVTNIYGVNTIAGTNLLPQSIQIGFNEPLNPATITSNSVLLEASDSQGNFGTVGSKMINLAGLLSFNPANDILTINTTGIFTSAAADNDEYRLILKGTGSAVIRDTDGLALDGFNILNGNQLPLPSGSDDFPGSDFQVTFDIDTHAPSIVAGTFKLDPASDSSGGLSITNINEPTFDGTITDIFPPTNPLLGDTVFIDVSTTGSPFDFNLIDAGVGTTDANGNFKITLTTPIPDTATTPYGSIFGPNGIQGSPPSVFTLVRVRIVDQAGNVSNFVTDPASEYSSEGALVPLQVDTAAPKVLSLTPASNTVATVDGNGNILFTVTFNKNIKTSTLNANSVQVFRTGGTGSFANPIAVPIIPTSFTETYVTSPASQLGYEVVTFAVAAPLPNDQYEVILKGTGTAPITDIAGNPLSGDLGPSRPAARPRPAATSTAAR